jgi:inosine-uridine nucleoside N-ribohydrolase
MEMENFPIISARMRKERLTWPSGKTRIVIDTDTFNEIDDQFALIYALLSGERLTIEAIYAAPFHNRRSSGPEEGMEKSYQEILKVIALQKMSKGDFVYKGSTGFLRDYQRPYKSEAAVDLIKRALSSPPEEPLYVVAIGAITNIASAILMEPSIIERIVVVWLGGHALEWPNIAEFNLKQDVLASRLILDCGVPLVLFPCWGVSSSLTLERAEVDTYIRGKGVYGQFLAELFINFKSDPKELLKIIWDIAPFAWLVNEEWTETKLIESPLISDRLTWETGEQRHLIRYCSNIDRDPVYHDFYEKLKKAA